MFREPKPGYAEIAALVSEIAPNYPPVADIECALRELYAQHIEAYKSELAESGLVYDEDTKKQDPWRGIYNYRHAEYRDADGRYVPESKAKEKQARVWVWREDNPSAPARKQAESTRDPDDPNYRFYRPCTPSPVSLARIRREVGVSPILGRTVGAKASNPSRPRDGSFGARMRQRSRSTNTSCTK